MFLGGPDADFFCPSCSNDIMLDKFNSEMLDKLNIEISQETTYPSNDPLSIASKDLRIMPNFETVDIKQEAIQIVTVYPNENDMKPSIGTLEFSTEQEESVEEKYDPYLELKQEERIMFSRNSRYHCSLCNRNWENLNEFISHNCSDK